MDLPPPNILGDCTYPVWILPLFATQSEMYHHLCFLLHVLAYLLSFPSSLLCYFPSISISALFWVSCITFLPPSVSSFTSPHFTRLLASLLLYLHLCLLTHFPLHFSSAMVFLVSSMFLPFLSLFSQRCHILSGSSSSCAAAPYCPWTSWLETVVPSTGHAFLPALQLPKTPSIYATYSF